MTTPEKADRSVVKVRSCTPAADGILAIELEHPEGHRLPPWTPGAHIDLILPNGQTRQYSLCGDRYDAYRYRIGVLREPASRGGSEWIHEQLAPGHILGFGGPRNHFPLVPSASYLFIAGGIGITPLLPMLRQADQLGADWQLLYGGRTLSSMAFRDELNRYGDRIHIAPQDEHGLLNLTGFIGRPHTDTQIYGCGPAPLLEALAKACADWPPYTLRTERFSAPDLTTPRQTGPFTVHLNRRGQTLTVRPDESVLDVVRQAGVEMLSSCGQGVCGTCEATVLDGVPDHRDAVLDDTDRASNDCMMLCVSRSCTAQLVLDL
ncbi:PDR/VanB family oxidoreductase [Streptomyces sp. NPDC051956]|uniref:PDR/VanB family oxidoreductase n=1 Tax=Streptomyces sp. NPDC051956 TaxID=3365677 RepID=UPI0037D2B72D